MVLVNRSHITTFALQWLLWLIFLYATDFFTVRMDGRCAFRHRENLVLAVQRLMFAIVPDWYAEHYTALREWNTSFYPISGKTAPSCKGVRQALSL